MTKYFTSILTPSSRYEAQLGTIQYKIHSKNSKSSLNGSSNCYNSLLLGTCIGFLYVFLTYTHFWFVQHARPIIKVKGYALFVDMSLCTLPSPVSAELLSLSPVASVALFVTDKQLSLCRKSGQQVWGVRIFNRSPIVAVSWSSDGELFALFHENAEVTVCSVTNGRPIEVSLNFSDVTSVAWVAQPALNQNSLANLMKQNDIWSAVNEFGGLNDDFEATPVAAMGTKTGNLRVCLYGALDIGDVRVESGPRAGSAIDFVVANESNDNYLVVQGQQLTRVRSKPTTCDPDVKHNPTSRAELQQVLSILGVQNTNFTAEMEKQRIQRLALAIRLIFRLEKSSLQLNRSLEAMNKLNTEFVKPIGFDEIKNVLLKALVFGELSQTEWINSQHEQGFKIWYKSCLQHWDELRASLTEQLLPLVEQIIVMFGSLGVELKPALLLQESLFELTQKVATHHEAFEKQATFLEKVFTDEIDRPIQVTTLSACDAEDIAQALFSSSSLGTLETSLGTDIVEQSTVLRGNLEETAASSRRDLMSRLEVVHSVQLDSEVMSVRAVGDSFALILKSNQIVHVSNECVVYEINSIEGTNPVFTGFGSDILSIDQANSALIHSNGTRFELGFEPSALATRIDETENKVVACVLSHDCQHYQFVEIGAEEPASIGG